MLVTRPPLLAWLLLPAAGSTRAVVGREHQAALNLLGEEVPWASL